MSAKKALRDMTPEERLVGVNRRTLDGLFYRLGGTISPIRRTGEVRYYHPAFPHPIKANNRRKDATRLLAKLVSRLAKETADRG
jgi:hypothetical protein